MEGSRALYDLLPGGDFEMLDPLPQQNRSLTTPRDHIRQLPGHA
jgi:hypothetical protein